MSAEVLREAAALMRERAEKAEASWPSPWRYDKGCSEVHHSGDDFGAYDRPYVSAADGWHADEHQASWHPAVALAVATWLDAAALVMEVNPQRHRGMALAVARAYLGDSA